MLNGMRDYLSDALAGTLVVLVSAVPAIAQDTEGNSVRLETITVSGELIERSQQRTGTSVEILDAEALEKRPAITNMRDVLENTVNVTMPTGAAKAPTIRGVDGTGPAENANAFFAGSRARMGLRIDGRPASYNEIVFGNSSLWDVEKVEILRGAQSTPVGRNAIAGNVVITTKNPTFEQSGAVQTSVGNYEGRRFSGMVNTPLVEDLLAARFAADWQAGESSVNYQPFPGTDNPGEIRALSLRGKLLARPNLGLDSTLLLTASHSSYKAPQGEIIVRPFEERNSNFPAQPVHKPSTTSLGGEFEVDLDENWRLELDASVTDFRFTRTVTPDSSNARIDTTELAMDPRVRYSGDNGFEALLGTHLYRARQDEFIEFVSHQNFDDETDTYALYGETIIPLADAWELTVGARYEQEQHRRSGGDATGTVASIDSDRTFNAFLPRVGLNWEAAYNQNYGVQISKGYNAGGGGIAFGSPSPFPIVHYEYDSETVWNYEIYGRQTLMDGRLGLTQNLFYARYTDMQLPFDLTPLDTRDESFVVRNADQVVTYGAELGATFALFENVDLFGNVGLLKTEVEEYPGSGIEGNSLFGAPNITGSAGVSWQQDGWNASLAARYSDSYFTDINNRPRGKTDAYIVTDAEMGYAFGSFRIFGEIRNIFDTDTAVAYYPGTTEAADTAVLLQPRTFRIGISARF